MKQLKHNSKPITYELVIGLGDTDILIQTSNASKNHSFAYKDYLDILHKGT